MICCASADGAKSAHAARTAKRRRTLRIALGAARDWRCRWHAAGVKFNSEFSHERIFVSIAPSVRSSSRRHARRRLDDHPLRHPTRRVLHPASVRARDRRRVPRQHPRQDVVRERPHLRRRVAAARHRAHRLRLRRLEPASKRPERVHRGVPGVVRRDSEHVRDAADEVPGLDQRRRELRGHVRADVLPTRPHVVAREALHAQVQALRDGGAVRQRRRQDPRLVDRVVAEAQE
eukprot:29242-Pelagococcus_subviridis.AAC.2